MRSKMTRPLQASRISPERRDGPDMLGQMRLMACSGPFLITEPGRPRAAVWYRVASLLSSELLVRPHLSDSDIRPSRRSPPAGLPLASKRPGPRRARQTRLDHHCVARFLRATEQALDSDSAGAAPLCLHHTGSSVTRAPHLVQARRRPAAAAAAAAGGSGAGLAAAFAHIVRMQCAQPEALAGQVCRAMLVFCA